MLVFVESTGYSCLILMKIKFSLDIFEKYSNIKFHEYPSRGSRVIPCGQADRRTDGNDETNSRFSQFCDGS